MSAQDWGRDGTYYRGIKFRQMRIMGNAKMPYFTGTSKNEHHV
jgi:hypothetical protein